jgi:predicted butyrate kinase (DUF1464 family)
MDGGHDMGDGGGYLVDAGNGSSSFNTFLAMGVMSALLAFGSAQIAGKYADYSSATIDSCVQATYNVKNEFKPNFSDKAKNIYCEPVITAYVGNERNPNHVKDSDLKSETANKIAELRSMYIPPTQKSDLKHN